MKSAPAAARESSSVDVVVIGGGAAGLMAAASARAQGASVHVVKDKDGATALSSGAIDIADADRALAPSRAADPFAPTDIARSIERLVVERPRHPYARLGEEGRARLDEALSLFGALARGAPLVKRADGKNLVVLSALGTTKRAALCSAALDLSALDVTSGPLGVVAPRGLAGFDARDVARVLGYIARRAGRDLEIVELDVEHPWRGAPADPLTFSRRLDANEEARARLVDAIVESVRTENAARAHDAKLRAVLLPVPLGVASAEGARRAIEERSSVKTGELLAHGLGAPGLRLAEALESGARERDIVISRGRVVSASIVDGAVRALQIDDDGHARSIAARAVVLATGRFLSGGFTDDGPARECVFGLPIAIDGAPIDDRFVGDLVGQRPSAEHPLLRAGIVVDDALRPRARDGSLLAANLFAAGSVIGGYDPARDGSGLGVPILTGFVAGERAAHAASSDSAARLVAPDKETVPVARVVDGGPSRA